MANLPQVNDIREFVKENPGATLIEIRDHFGQKNEDVDYFISTPNPDGGQFYFLCDVTKDFYMVLQEFLRGDDVVVKEDPMACLISDDIIQTSRPGMQFVPVSVSIGKVPIS